MEKQDGVALPELVLAIFLLAIGLIALVTLLQSQRRHSQRISRMRDAVVLGEKTLTEIRAWAEEPANFGSNWGAYNGRTLVDPEFPNLVAEVRCDPSGQSLDSPCSSLESRYPGRERRLARTVVPVEVRIRWGSDDQLLLHTYIAEPYRPLSPTAQINISQVTGTDPVTQFSTAGYSAELVDDSGEPVGDLTYTWYLEPIDGNATLDVSTVSRDYREAHLLHQFQLVDGTPAVAGGNAGLRVKARYFGREIWDSDPSLPPTNLVRLAQ